MTSPLDPIPVIPIGHFVCDQRYRYEQPRQGVLFDHTGTVVLETGRNYEQGLEELAGFSRIWLIYLFHLNAYWAPKIEPPVSNNGAKVGVFASRSPHRPSKIGMTCVTLESVEGRSVHVSGSDLLDGTPILDIKPYLPYCDSFPDAETGWLPSDPPSMYTVTFAEKARAQIDWIHDQSAGDLASFARVQLSSDPLNARRKRVREEGSGYVIAYRTWRIHFSLSETAIEVQQISSGYPEADLASGAEDPHKDKDIHRAWHAADLS